MTTFVKQALEAALEREMGAHLEGSKAQDVDNKRNGKLTKPMRNCDMGKSELVVHSC